MRATDQEQLEMIGILIEKARVEIHFKKDSPILASAQIIMGEIMEINGFTIRKSDFDDALWVQPPTFGRNYAKSFFLNDKKLWEILTEKVERAYKNKLDEEGTADAVEDIPF